MDESMPPVSNPYWDEVKDYPDAERHMPWNRGTWQPSDLAFLEAGVYDPTKMRHHLAQKYSWALPSPKAVEWLAEKTQHTGVVEIGAGRGYWASLLAQYDVDVICYDQAVPGQDTNGYHPGGTTYHPVQQGGIQSVKLHGDRALFLCWPPYDAPMARKVLQAYPGNTLVYCGEGSGGCTGDDSFFALLRQEWTLKDTCSDHVAWYGIHDELHIYERNT